MSDFEFTATHGMIVLLAACIGYILGRAQVSGPTATTQKIARGEPITDQTIEEALRDGNKILAIKLYRQLNNCGLKEAKEAIERLYTPRH